jgi:hypothetical protein
MEIIVVSGKAHSVGKTMVTNMVIKNVTGQVSALKCSIHDGVERVVSSEPAIIQQAGTDTALFAASGADRVVYLQTDPAHLQEDLEKALSLAGEQEFLVIEGNRVLDYLNPDLIIFVTRPGSEPKPSAVQAEAKADILVDSDEIVANPHLRMIPFTFHQSRISCVKAHLMAKVTGVALQQIGQWIDEKGIKVKHCQLGLFS